jgi:hypothetical protein
VFKDISTLKLNSGTATKLQWQFCNEQQERQDESFSEGPDALLVERSFVH